MIISSNCVAVRTVRVFSSGEDDHQDKCQGEDDHQDKYRGEDDHKKQTSLNGKLLLLL